MDSVNMSSKLLLLNSYTSNKNSVNADANYFVGSNYIVTENDKGEIIIDNCSNKYISKSMDGNIENNMKISLIGNNNLKKTVFNIKSFGEFLNSNLENIDLSKYISNLEFPYNFISVSHSKKLEIIESGAKSIACLIPS